MTTRSIGPYSRPKAILQIDGRTKTSRALEAARAELIAHVGGQPSAVERRLIDRAAVLTVHVDLLDQKAFDEGGLSERDSRSYLAWSNTLTRTLRTLGLKSPPPRQTTLAEILAGHRAAAEAKP